ncbi:UDP-N-acetylmuramoyl-L-alanyl-D-glutamate--2,6-diaminopimelate ligase [Candidatus Saccharibacteria bacterium]|nr:MAG: UDP-N-acetylmuramoyl-L-alanyl-D-glutamate--2,6-diaminopimelate ligase [Candidatus Saccharibacteria bacterium]
MNIRSMVKRVVPKGVFGKVEPVGHLVEAVLWNVVYGFPGRGLKVIGVTGTNGKTTTSFLVHHMLVEAGYKAGLMTTVAYGVGTNITPQVHHMTNVGPRELMVRLKKMKAEGMDWLVLETTSHALAQHRTWGVPYSIAVVTNITHEHLDYHKTFENYRAAKRRLFEITQRNARGRRLGVVNADDAQSVDFGQETENRVSYGVEAGDVRATDVRLRADGISYTATAGTETYHITSQLPGSFNVYNTLAAVCVGQAVGLTREQVEQGIASLAGVEGRMTALDEGQPFSVVVDYAHTPDSFEKLLKDMRPVVKGKLIVMFGSAGRRDEAKRAVQGELAGKYADEVVVTEEDDRDCDGLEIMNQIASGSEKAGKVRENNLFLVHDRTEAIQFAVARAEHADDAVLLLGKGHEKDILRNGHRAAEFRHLKQDDTNPERVVSMPWDEIGTTKDALRSLKNKK